MSDTKYYERYKYYKARCMKLSFEMKKMETIMESCLLLLGAGRDCSQEHISLISPLNSSTPQELSILCHEESHDTSYLEPGGNKWEHISEEEVKRLKHADGTQNAPFLLPVQPPKDLNETLYEPKNTEVMKNEETNLKPACNTEGIQSEEVTTPNRKRMKSITKQRTPAKEHICKLPRCSQHQPFYVSSIREMNKLSPKTRRMASNQRSKSPKGM